jgi:hypothetical protein
VSRVRSRLRQVPLPLALLLGIACALSVSWSLSTAPLQGPDESEHLGYVARLAETGHIPSSTSGTTGGYAPDEAHALQDGGLLRLEQNRQARPPTTPQAEQRFRDFEKTLPDGAAGRVDGPTPVGVNPPLYYAIAAIGWKLSPGGHFFGHLFMVRLVGALLLMATVGFTWLLAGEAFGRRRLPQTVAAGVVALLPMDGFMSGAVNTDILLGTVWAAFAWLSLRTVRLGLTWQRAGVLALLAAASVLTHGRGLAILPALAVVFAVAWLRSRPSVRETVKALASSGLVLAIGLFVYRLLVSASGGGGSAFGGGVNLGHTGKFNVRQMLSTAWQFYLPKLDAMAARPGPAIGYRQIMVQQYFAGVFGLFEVYFPFWVYDLVQVAFGLLLLALYTLGAIRWRATLAHWPVVVVLGAMAFSMLALLHIASYRSLLQTSGENPLIVGRYLTPLSAILGVGIAAVVAGLPRRAAAVVSAVVLVGLLALSLGALGLNVERFYA